MTDRYVRSTPRWLADALDMWGDTTFRRMFVESGSKAHSMSVALTVLPDTDEPGGWSDKCRSFTGDPVPTSSRRELGDRLAGKRGRVVTRYEAEFDDSTLGKYHGSHIEKRLLGTVHRAYIDIENVLSEIFCYGNADARWIGRVALLMIYPERGPHAGAVEPSAWVEALKAHKPELWAMLDRNKARDLGRLATNIESVLRSSNRISREKALWRCRRAIGQRPVPLIAYEIKLAVWASFFGYFFENSEELEANSMRDAS